MIAVTIVLLACITFGTRYLFLEGRLPVRLGSNIKLFLSYSGPAVLTAITGRLRLLQQPIRPPISTGRLDWGCLYLDF